MAWFDDIDWSMGDAGEDDNFWGKLWDQDRMDDAWKGFFKEGGWKDWKSYVNPGGIVANPAGQIADPGNFFTAEEHENWLNGTGPSDRTMMSALIAGAAYGGGSAISGMGGSAGGGIAEAGRVPSYAGHAIESAGESGIGGGSTFASTASDYLGKAQKGLNAYDSMQPEQQVSEIEQPKMGDMPSNGKLSYPDTGQTTQEQKLTGMQGAGSSSLIEEFQKMLEHNDYQSLSADRKKLYGMVGAKYQ